MGGISLYPAQIEAVKQLSTGKILCGGVGTGKSRTSLAYYYVKNGGRITGDDNYIYMTNPQNLIIITTARKRDTKDWDAEMVPFLLSTNPEINYYNNTVIVDSWNNIGKYRKEIGAFFIFDEQRVVGSGAWVKSFLDIARKNDWILLSATPGDNWKDYIPVFVANGFYRNKTDFMDQHVIWSRYAKFPKIDRYIDTGRLIYYRNQLLVNIDYQKHTIRHVITIPVDYDKNLYRELGKTRWNPWENKPMTNAAELCFLWRKVVNSDESRQVKLLELIESNPKVIIFYNYDYELNILKSLNYGLKCKIAEWNGHRHEEIPKTAKWVYLVQYVAGAEGWNCVETDTIIFYSANYSYKVVAQAMGRIDRLNTKFKDLYYYKLLSSSPIDRAIDIAVNNKKNFQESNFVRM